MSIVKGLIAGAISGLVATKVKSLMEESYPVRDKNTDSPPVVLAERVLTSSEDETLTKASKKEAEKKIHWTFGVFTGALYGASVEMNPSNKKGLGTIMGTSLYGVTHGSILPLLKTEPWPSNNKKEYVRNEFLSHIVFGISTELVRRVVRKII